LTKPMLAWSIVGLGAGVNLMTVVAAGIDGIFLTAVSLGLTVLIGVFIGRWLRNSKEISTLITVGTAICGGSAIAAVSSVIRAKDESISVSLGVVFILNAVALFVFPVLGHLFGLSEEQFGLWSALAIHDTSSVVGATMQYGQHSLAIGTTVKLVRALWIIPVALLFAKFYAPEEETAPGQPKASSLRNFPWFIAGFVLMSALVTAFADLQAYGHQVESLAKRFLVATLYLIGCGLTLKTLKEVGLKTFLQGLILWVLVASVSLAYFRWS
ncbi:MAG: putative sulfate exporter family transporter, partial [Bdellovibrionaceae bacterium]|nr:putative sulfate exporter family transporter [Pseudobdellovibrionaceae bacterium]